MKRLLSWLLMLMFVLPLAAASGAVIEAPSRITGVTVFAGQALVTREARVTVAPGPNTIRIDVGAYRIDADAVTADVYGKGELLGVETVTLPVEAPSQDALRRIDDAIDALNQENRTLSDQRNALKKQVAFLDSMVDFAHVQMPRDMVTRMPETTAVEKTLTFIGSGYRRLYDNIRKIDVSVRKNKQKIDTLTRQRNDLKAPRANVRRTIEVLFRAESRQTLRVKASYLVENATWTPSYKASVPMDRSGVQLTLFADIAQTTGEDWAGIPVTVSNAVPLRGAGVPSLSTWWLDVSPPLARYAKKAVTDQALRLEENASKAMTAQLEAAPSAPAGFAAAERHRTPLAFEYTVPGPVDIASTGKKTLLPLLTKRLTGEFYDLSVPRRSPRTFLIGEIRSDQELLSGPMGVYFAGRYVGRTRLAEKTAGQPFRLNLGADRGVRVAFEKTKDQVKETFFGAIDRKTVSREIAYRITAENLKETAVTLRLVDHLPVSRTDRIVVKDIAITPEPTKKDLFGRTGVMRWDLNLAPHGKQVITIGFVVTYPKDMPPPVF